MIKNNRIHPWTITGLIDAEGSVGVNILRDNRRKSKYNITFFLEIGLNWKDKIILERIQAYFKVGNLYYKPRDKTYRWKVSNIKQLSNVIIPHLTKYPLLTKKHLDFELLKKIIEIINNKKHLTVDGMQEIVNLKASLNFGASDKLKALFPKIVAVPRSGIKFNGTLDPNWLSGFAEGESCFFVSIYNSPNSRLGLAVQLVFTITQHSRDIELLKNIENFFGCGRVKKRNMEACDFTVNSFKDFKEIIIPFFLNYPLIGSKHLNFNDLSKIVEIMKTKGHLTKKGLKIIKDIKANMNTKRKF